MLHRIIREPLVHFLFAGGLIFAVYDGVDRPAPEPEQNSILIGETEIAFLSTQFEKLWGRPPGEEDLAPLVREFIREEVLYREGLALGLDDDDVIVRRRIAQKMEFLIGDMAVPAEPDDETLARYLEENRETYLEPPQLTFTHRYFNRDRRGQETETDALAALAELQGRQVAEEIGDGFPLSLDYAGRTPREVAQIFGPAFAGQLLKAPVDQWIGPVASPYGLHLVRVIEQTAPRSPDLDELRERLSNDYSFAARRAANARALELLTERYRVVMNETPNQGL